MSVAGRNAIRGVPGTFWRAERTAAATGGGQMVTRWRKLVGRDGVRLELLPSTDRVMREVFGPETAATLMAMVDVRTGATDPAPGDVFVPASGHYAGLFLAVTAALPLGGRATQVALASTEAGPP